MPSEGNPFTLLESKVVYKNPWIQVTEDRVIRPGGEGGVFGVVTMKEGSTVLPVTSSGDVYLVLEYKYGIGRYSIEAMSGAMDGAEKPLDVMRVPVTTMVVASDLSVVLWLYIGNAADNRTQLLSSRKLLFRIECPSLLF